MFYFKKIVSYFDYFENEERKRNCGYAKLIIKDYEVTVEIHVKNIGNKESSMCDIVSIGRESQKIGRFVIDKGTGYYNAYHDRESMDGKGLSVFDMQGLTLSVGDGKYCQTEWKWEDVPEREIKNEVQEESSDENLYETIPEEEQQEERVLEEGSKGEISTEEFSEEAISAEEVIPKEELPTEEPAQEELPLYEDKWKQLCSTYPVCHPFGEREKYIAITPKDFVVLRKEYQNLVSNSFLLHSFYNYHHVILGKMEIENEEAYYIGVPGNYFEREKNVAVMFGFEGFARSETGNRKRDDCAQESHRERCGDFGYYMKKVEI